MFARKMADELVLGISTAFSFCHPPDVDNTFGVTPGKEPTVGAESDSESALRMLHQQFLIVYRPDLLFVRCAHR